MKFVQNFYIEPNSHTQTHSKYTPKEKEIKKRKEKKEWKRLLVELAALIFVFKGTVYTRQ